MSARVKVRFVYTRPAISRKWAMEYIRDHDDNAELAFIPTVLEAWYTDEKGIEHYRELGLYYIPTEVWQDGIDFEQQPDIEECNYNHETGSLGSFVIPAEADTAEIDWSCGVDDEVVYWMQRYTRDMDYVMRD